MNKKKIVKKVNKNSKRLDKVECRQDIMDYKIEGFEKAQDACEKAQKDFLKMKRLKVLKIIGTVMLVISFTVYKLNKPEDISEQDIEVAQGFLSWAIGLF